ncbi:MAG: carbon storage regulator [Planctomycetaceae bacterium]
MLVLSRRPGERVMIGDQIVVTVVRIGPNNVRLGIEAPRDLNIVREELCLELTGAEASERSAGAAHPL